MTSATALRDLVARTLADGGIATEPAGDTILHAGDVPVVVTAAQGESGGTAMVEVPATADFDAVHIVLFIDGGGEPSGAALVAGSATLEDLVGGEARTVRVNTLPDATPQGPLDACVVPLSELAGWVGAEIADLTHDDDD